MLNAFIVTLLMYNKNFAALIAHLERKLTFFQIRVTTRITGETKNKFLNDCLKREKNESQVAAHIFETYYSAVTKVPGLIDKEPNQIQKYIIDKIKL